MPSVKAAKQKGRIFEVWCRNVLALSLGLPFDAMNSRGAGAPGCDTWPSTAIRDLIPYCVESKARTNLSPYQVMRQARGNCYEGLFPLAMAHYRGEHLTFMPTVHFLALLQELNDREGWAERVAAREEKLRKEIPTLAETRVDEEAPRKAKAKAKAVKPAARQRRVGKQ